MAFGKEHMGSCVDLGNKLIASSKMQEAMMLVERGL